MRAATFLLVATLATAPTSASPPQDSLPISVDDPEAYAVYASLLPNEWSIRVAHAKTLVFQEETGTNWRCMPTGQPLEQDWRPVVDSFRLENAKPRQLRAGFQLGTPYILVPSADITAQFRDRTN